MTEPTDAELQQLWQNSNPTNFDAISFARAVLQRWGQPSGAGNHPYAIQWDAELGRTAMRFVDRAGDVHPGIDDAETICAEFHAAMSAVIERMPHVQRMSTTPQPTQAQAGAVPVGFRLVPIEPTVEILQAMDRAFSDAMHVGVPVSPEAYAAMIKAVDAADIKGADHSITAHGAARKQGGTQ